MTDFEWTKSQFYVPEGMIYLDGNSLGPLPLNAKDRVSASMTDQWGEMLITGWNKAGWMDMPRRVVTDCADFRGRKRQHRDGRHFINQSLSGAVLSSGPSSRSTGDFVGHG